MTDLGKNEKLLQRKAAFCSYCFAQEFEYLRTQDEGIAVNGKFHK